MPRPRMMVCVGLAALVLGSCARGTRLVIEGLQGQTVEQLDRDRWECGLRAQEQVGLDPARSTTTGAVVGALVGAAAGAALGSAIGAGLSAAAEGAALGGVAGTSVGTPLGGTLTHAGAMRARDRAFDACLRDRGYGVREAEGR